MDRRDFFHLQLLAEDELDGAFEGSELAQRSLMVDMGITGVVQGLSVVERSTTPDITVEAINGEAYNQAGERMQVPSTQVVDVSTDFNSVSTDVASGGNEKIVSLFLKFERSLSDPRIDGNAATVYFERNESFSFYVVQGSESVAPPTPPALEVDKILLADIRRSFAQTQIFNADITAPGGTYTAITNRRQAAFALTAGALDVLEGTAEESDQALITHLNNHITGVANLHPALSVDYAGGPAWHDATTNPAATVEVQLDKLITDLVADAGSDRIGGAAMTAWRGGRTRVAGSISDQLEAIGVDLSAQSAADDGAERIGAEARTGTQFDLAIGSVASQLQAIIDTTTFDGANTWTAIQTQEGGLTLDGGGLAFPIDSVADDVEWTVKANGSLQFKEQTSGDVLLDISPGASAGVDLLKIGLTRLEFSAIAQERFIYIANYSGTGASNGSNMSFQGQKGQTQTGANANNDGGDFNIYLGDPGTGGSGAAGKIGSYIKRYNGRLVVESAETFSAISGFGPVEILGFAMANGDTVTAVATIIADDGTPTEAWCTTSEQTYRMTGGTVTKVGAPTTHHNVKDGSITGNPTIAWDTSPGGGSGVEVGVDPDGETLTGTVYLTIKTGN